MTQIHCKIKSVLNIHFFSDPFPNEHLLIKTCQFFKTIHKTLTILSCMISGAMNWAVPTKLDGLSAQMSSLSGISPIRRSFKLEFLLNSGVKSLAVPKSVIFMFRSSSSKMFSGFTSLCDGITWIKTSFVLSKQYNHLNLS